MLLVKVYIHTTGFLRDIEEKGFGELKEVSEDSMYLNMLEVKSKLKHIWIMSDLTTNGGHSSITTMDQISLQLPEEQPFLILSQLTYS